MDRETKLLIVSLLFVVTTGTLVIGGRPYLTPNKTAGAPKSDFVPLSRSQLLAGRYSVEHSKPFVLVEFGDYQCPPCQRAYPILTNFARTHSETVQLLFRHLPLTTLHPLAYNAAVFAESAREQGKFEEAHALLFQSQGKVTKEDLASYRQRLHLQSTATDQPPPDAAQQRVKEDVKLAALAGVDSTPALLLCSPSGKIRKIEVSDLDNPLLLSF